MKIYKLTRDQLKKLQAGETISVNGVQYTYEDSAIYLPIDGESTYTLQNQDNVIQLYKDNAVISEIEISNVPHAVKADNANQIVNPQGEETMNYSYLQAKFDSIPTKVSQLANDSNFTSNTGTITGIKMNGASKGTSGVVDLGTVITAHQDISGKQDKLTAAQLNAVNSGITSAKVEQYNGYNTTISDHITRLTTLEGKPGLDKTGTVSSIKINGTSKTPTNGAVDLGTVITSHQDISGKQDKLSTAQLNAANSGITSDKVKQYDGYNSTIGNHTTRITALEAKPGLDKTGTVSSIKINGIAKTPTNGVVDLGTVITSHQSLDGKQDKLTTAQLNAVNSGITSDKVKTYDGYHDNIGSLNSALSNQTQRIGALEAKPGLDKVGTITSINNQQPDSQGNIALNIPSPVSEATVSGWGFTKNTGTYSKPSSGIPKTDLASGVQTSLGKADTSVQKVKINGAEKAPTSGVVDLGNILPNIVLTTNTGMFASSMTFTQATGNEIFAAITKLGLKVGSHFMLNDGTANWANATIYSLSSTSCTFRATLFDAAQIRLYNFTVNNGSSGNSIAFSYLLPPVSSYNESTRNPVAGQTIYSDLAKKVNTSTTIAGKALTDNISTSALRTALNVEDGANKIIVDENFNEDSPNPVQNKTITKMFSNFIGVKLIGPNNTSVETDLMYLNRVVNIDESIYTQLRNLHHLYMTNGAPCNIYIYLSDKIFAFAGANNSVFDFIKLYDKGINEADIYLLRIFDNNTAIITSVQNQFDSKYAAQSALANYVSRNSSETINGTKTFAEDVIFNNTLKGQGDTACIKLNSSVGQDATTLEIYPDGTFGFLFANGDMGDYFKLPSISNQDYDKDDPYILATTSDIRGSYEVFKRTNMTSTSYSTNWTIKSNTTLPEGAKLVMQISSGPYNTSADNMVNKSVFIWNIPINWNNNQTTENFQTETTTSSYNGSISIDGGVSISFSIYQGKTDIIVRGRNANSTPGKVEFWTYK